MLDFINFNLVKVHIRITNLIIIYHLNAFFMIAIGAFFLSRWKMILRPGIKALMNRQYSFLSSASSNNISGQSKYSYR